MAAPTRYIGGLKLLSRVAMPCSRKSAFELSRRLRNGPGNGYARSITSFGLQRRSLHTHPAHRSESTGDHKKAGDIASEAKQRETINATLHIKPMMQIAFTCNKCKTRVHKQFSKHAYTKGLVIITCPGCQAHHLIADNIGWFAHFKGRNIEEILAEKNETVRRLQESEDGTLDISPDDQEAFEKLRELLRNNGNQDSSGGTKS